MENNKFTTTYDISEENTEKNVSRWQEYQTLIQEEITLNDISK